MYRLCQSFGILLTAVTHRHSSVIVSILYLQKEDKAENIQENKKNEDDDDDDIDLFGSDDVMIILILNSFLFVKIIHSKYNSGGFPNELFSLHKHIFYFFI